MGWEMPESKDLPSSLVTVWPACVMLVQVTFVPTLTVSVAGLKAKLPLLSVVMGTAWPLLAAVVAVGAVPVAALGVEPEPEGGPPPHAVQRTNAGRTSPTLWQC